MLPAALLLGTLLHRWCAALSGAVPFIIFCILLLTFCAADLRRLRLSWLDAWLVFFQTAVCCGVYALMRVTGAGEVLSQGVMMGMLCPVASSVAVVSCMLGADRQTVTTYAIVGNLTAAIAAPVVFSAIGVHPELSFGHSLWLILRRIAPTLALPFVIAWVLQRFRPRVNAALARHSGAAFYLWAIALLFTLGQTIHYIVGHGDGVWNQVAQLGAASLAVCILQFAVGRRIGRHYGDTVSGGQLLGQKNTAMGIWMANTFLNPLSSVFMAFYSVYQNLFNSWQLWCHEHRASLLQKQRK